MQITDNVDFIRGLPHKNVYTFHIITQNFDSMAFLKALLIAFFKKQNALCSDGLPRILFYM